MDIKIGDGATECVGSDRYPYTVINIVKSTVIEVQRDNAEPAEGHDYYGTQKYNYSANPEGQIEVISLRKNGLWYPVGKAIGQVSPFRVGNRSKYQDPSF